MVIPLVERKKKKKKNSENETYCFVIGKSLQYGQMQNFLRITRQIQVFVENKLQLRQFDCLYIRGSFKMLLASAGIGAQSRQLLI